MLVDTRLASLGAIVLAAVLFGAARAGAEAWDDDWREAPSPEEYEESLAPYGAWVEDRTLGYVWRPRVWTGWAPYVDGRWVWTAWGWTWLSSEPWGWTFHYGRWSWAPYWGWVWVPGTVWAPAWVSWHWGDGYVGWAPHGIVSPALWIWVRDRDFCAPRVRHVLVEHRSLPSRVRTLWHGRSGGDDPPPRHAIERVSRHRLEDLTERPSRLRREDGARRHGPPRLPAEHADPRARDSHIGRRILGTGPRVPAWRSVPQRAVEPRTHDRRPHGERARSVHPLGERLRTPALERPVRHHFSARGFAPGGNSRATSGGRPPRGGERERPTGRHLLVR